MNLRLRRYHNYSYFYGISLLKFIISTLLHLKDFAPKPPWMKMISEHSTDVSMTRDNVLHQSNLLRIVNGNAVCASKHIYSG